VFCVFCGSAFLVYYWRNPFQFAESNWYTPARLQRGLTVRKENGTAKHAEHAKGGGALQGQDDAFDLKTRGAEVE